MIRRRVLLFLSAVAAAGAAGWFIARAPSADDGALRRVRATGVVRVGYAVEPPYATVTPNGEVTGESPEIARRTAAALGVPRVEWVQTTFNSLIPELEAGRFDVVAAGLFITLERAERVSFSRPTFRTRSGLLVRKGNPLGLRSGADLLARPAARIAVLEGAVEHARLVQWDVGERQLVVVPDAVTGRAAIESGLADGLMLSAVTVRWAALRDPNGATACVAPFERAQGITSRPDYGAFAFRKDDRSLRAAWDAALEGYLGSQEHRRTVAAFGFTDDELPDLATAEEVLSP